MGEGKARERQALKDNKREDINLTEICDQLRVVATDTAAAVATELGAEGDLCLLNPVMVQFAQHVKARGLKVLVVSDIYLSAEQLRAILRANHLDPALFDFVFTSCDVGLCKWTGNLFRHVLKAAGLAPGELLHVGDNFHSDVAGARKLGVRGVHYVQSTADMRALLDREKLLLGGNVPVFNAHSLRLLAARNFGGDSAEAFFGREGALLMGPILTRYATWACGQFVAAGVRKVGAFMREGELLGQLLQREANALGHALEITPLYVNRKSTDLAAIGKLTAENLIDWLERRQTLPIKTILEHFGLRAAELRHLPFSAEEKVGTPERILRLAKFLFTPEIAHRIEARSAEERRKVIDYLRPWLDSGGALGLCDLGYNASAQMQLKRILDLEGNHTKLIGCYVVTCERAAIRVLDGLDVRHFLGAFGNPAASNYAFLRSPAFIEQSIVAGCGTTIGYERLPDGSVRPLLDEMRFPDDLLRRQRAFKDGVLFYQHLWLHFRASKPGVLDGTTDFSRRVLAGLDAGSAPILARATAFPLQSELVHFGAIPLDDFYFAEGVKTICGPAERAVWRTKGYAKTLTEQGVLWPQAVHQIENPRASSDFFAYAKAMLLCNPEGDHDGAQLDLTIAVVAGRNPATLRECLNGVKAVSSRALRYEVLILTAKDDPAAMAVASEFTREITRLRVFERKGDQSLNQQLNGALDGSSAPFVLVLDDGVRLAPAYDAALLGRARQSAQTGAVVGGGFEEHLARCLLLRRAALVEGLAFNEQLSLPGGAMHLLLNLRSLGWQAELCREAVAQTQSDAAMRVGGSDTEFIKRAWPDFSTTVSRMFTAPDPGGAEAALPKLDWIGTFLDHGSLSHVNRQLTGALEASGKARLQRVSCAQERGFAHARSDAAVTVRHAWPPNWERPASGKLVVIQPWEFGALPLDWVKAAQPVDEFWLPSEYVRRVYAESGVPAGKLVVVPNGVDAEKFQPQAKPMTLATRRKFKFLFVGGTIHRKGPDLLLKAYLANFTAADDVCLVIKDFGGQSVYAGQTYEAQIRAAHSQPNAPEILYLNSELPPDALPGLYTACDCLVLPYRGEGFGLPVLEAMACGLPVIVTAGGATDDFVRDDFGWRVPAQKCVFGHEVSGLKLAGAGWLLEPDLKALGDALREAWANPIEARHRGRLAGAHARQNCSWSAVATIVSARLTALTAQCGGGRSAEQNAPVVAVKPARAAKITLPECALLGHLAEARGLVKQRKSRPAWEATLAALAVRPFHPEAYLLLAEIAQLVGAGEEAKRLAEHARGLAPGWRPARQFLNQRLNGTSRPEWLKLPDFISRAPQISVCLIVKNEEKFLGQCLQSVRGVASQIVVVDTGSTDRTVAIAREHGAEVHSFTWCDDFSAARNAALARVTGDWVLVLDADEELSGEARVRLDAAVANPAVMAWRLPIVDVGREAEGCSYVPRLFRNAPGLFYVGRVHEQVFSSLEVRRAEWGLENKLGEATLIHHGYTAEVTRDRNKVERNLRLLEQAIEEFPGEPHLLMNLGLELSRSGREAESLARYQEAFAILSAKPAAEVVPELCETLLTQLCSRLTSARRFDEVVRVLTSALARPALTASLHFSLGLAQLELKRFSEAADQMRQCLAKRAQRGLAPINKDILTAAPRHCLALCLAQAGDAAGAEQEFKAGLAESGHEAAVRIDYAQFLVARGRAVEAMERLHEVVSADATNALAWRLGGQIALSQPEFLEFARDWTGEALRHHAGDQLILAQRAEAVLLSGDAGGAREGWARIADGGRNASVQAALILVDLVAGDAGEISLGRLPELAVSRAFITWYQKLITANAGALVLAVNDRLDLLQQVLPTAAKILESAVAAADEPLPVAV